MQDYFLNRETPREKPNGLEGNAREDDFITCLEILSWTVLHCCLGTVMQTSSSLSKHLCSATVVVIGFSTVMHLGRVMVLHSRRGTVTHSCLKIRKFLRRLHYI